MSTIKSSAEHLTLNADGASKDIKFQANGVEKASISSAGAFTSTTIDATALTGTIPNFTSTGIDDNADATAITIDSSENVGIGTTSPNEAGFQAGSRVLSIQGDAADDFGVLELISPDTTSSNRIGEVRFGNLDGGSSYASHAGLRATRDGADNSSALSLWTTTAGAFGERMRIDSAGRVTMPNQPAFYAYEGSTQNSDSKYTVEFTTAATNVGSHYNTSTYRFTAPVAGTYFFSYGWMTSTENNRHHIEKNGSLVGQAQYTSNDGYSRAEASAVITCAVNDYIEVKNNVNSSSTESSMHGSYRYFVGHLIG